MSPHELWQDPWDTSESLSFSICSIFLGYCKSNMFTRCIVKYSFPIIMIYEDHLTWINISMKLQVTEEKNTKDRHHPCRWLWRNDNTKKTMYNFHDGRLAPPHYNHVRFYSIFTMIPGFRHYIDTVKNDYLDLLVFDPSAQEIFYTSFIYSHRPYSCSNYQTTCRCSRHQRYACLNTEGGSSRYNSSICSQAS